MVSFKTNARKGWKWKECKHFFNEPQKLLILTLCPLNIFNFTLCYKGKLKISKQALGHPDWVRGLGCWLCNHNIEISPYFLLTLAVKQPQTTWSSKPKPIIKKKNIKTMLSKWHMLLHHSEGKSFTIACILQSALRFCQTSAASWFLVVILVRDDR